MMMQKYLIAVIAASTVLFSGCGNSEEPKMSQAGGEAKQEKTTTAMAPSMSEESMKATAGAEAMAEEAPPAMEEAMPEAGSAPMEETTVAQAGADAGKQAYDKICFACHAQGIAGAPKLGDKAAWEPRIAKGMDTLVNNAINGFQGSTGMMPAKGGMPTLTDEEVRAAVSYMVEQAK